MTPPLYSADALRYAAMSSAIAKAFVNAVKAHARSTASPPPSTREIADTLADFTDGLSSALRARRTREDFEAPLIIKGTEIVNVLIQMAQIRGEEFIEISALIPAVRRLNTGIQPRINEQPHWDIARQREMDMIQLLDDLRSDAIATVQDELKREEAEAEAAGGPRMVSAGTLNEGEREDGVGASKKAPGEKGLGRGRGCRKGKS